MEKKLTDDPIPSHWIYPTAEEVKNGWTVTSLNRYLEDRKKAQLKEVSDPQDVYRPELQNGKYNPHDYWGR